MIKIRREDFKYYLKDKNYYFAIVSSMVLYYSFIYFFFQTPFVRDDIRFVISSFLFGTLCYFNSKKSGTHYFISTLIGSSLNIWGFIIVYIWGKVKQSQLKPPY